jgi:hypothetical protein
MTFERLKKTIAKAIDNNDMNWALETLADFLKWDSLLRWDLNMVRYEHERHGHLTQENRLRRDGVLQALEGSFVDKYNQEMWDELRI